MARTWTVGACAHNGSFDDRESMWADNEPTSGTYGRMFVSYNDYTTSCGAGGCLFVTYSDNGVSWSTPKQLNTGTFFRNVQVTGSPRGAKLIGKNSTVFIASMDEGGGGNATRQNLMFRSTDGGKTWTQVTMGPRLQPGRRSELWDTFTKSIPSSGTWAGGNRQLAPMAWSTTSTPGQGRTATTGTSFTNVRLTTARLGRKQSSSTPTRTLQTRRSGCLRCPPLRTATSPPLGMIVARPPAPATTSEIRDVTTSASAVSRSTNGASWLADITISTEVITQPAQDDQFVVSCYAGDYDYNTALNAADAGNSTGSAYITWTDGRA